MLRKTFVLMAWIVLVLAVISFIGSVNCDCSNIYPETPTFGRDCMFRCHCIDDEKCNNTETGECTNGCAPGWMGPGCQYRNVIKNFLETEQLGKNNNLNKHSRKAIDGDIETCSETNVANYNGKQAWRVSLDREYHIVGMKIFLVENDLENFRKFRIETGTTRNNFTNVCYQHQNMPGLPVMEVICIKPVLAKDIKLVLGQRNAALRLCEVQIYGGRQISFNMPTEQSTNYTSWLSRKAVDGRIPTINDTAGQIEAATCSATGGKENNPWWYIDLQQEYIVKDISFYGRISTTEQSQGFYISVGNCPSSTTDIFYDDPVGSSLPSDYQPRSTKLANAIRTNCVKIEKRPYNQTASLSICELYIFADCPPNQCGWSCEKTCYCNSEITGQMKINGFCPYGCTGRWTGIDGACNTECNDTSSGDVCQNVCGNCLDSPCDVVTGECKRGCSGPWVPPHCTKECDPGKYGRNCTERCGKCFQNDACNLETGLCPRGCWPGYRGNRCKETCLSGTYGTNCGEKCGNCANRTACNIISGSCASGCDRGWRGSRCVTPCSDGYFGTNCERKCGQCKNNQTCDHITGECTNGCNPGFNGLLCDNDSNLLAKIKAEIVVSMSSVYQDWKAERSFDGIFVADPTVCQCCSGTRNDMLSWLKIDLQRQHPIAKVIVYGRVNENVFQQLTGFDLRLTNDSLSNADPVVANVPVSNNTRELVIPNTLAQYIEIRRPGKLTICEVQIIEGECSVGRFGEECSKECHCADQKLCDRNLGTCMSTICDIGFHGEACDTECPAQHFGQGCIHKCHCSKGANCSTDYGVCPNSCAPGYEGSHCENECAKGKFGLSCRLNCGNCKDNKACNHVTGKCPDGCKSGYIGSSCREALNLIETIKATVHTSMSSTHMNWTSDKAIDGETGPDPVQCRCCSSTNNEHTSWWRADLGNRYPINRVEVFGRQQENSYQQLQGFKLNLKNDTSEMNEPVYINTVMDEDHINITLPNTVAQIIEIERVGKLTICEVEVYEGDCPLGRYGEECREYCHCADNMECDRVQGICESSVCEVGWIGDSCNKKCPHGYYGLHCGTQCGMCNMTETCDHKTGFCSRGCEDGYNGYFCNERHEGTRATTSAASTMEMSSKQMILGTAVGIPLASVVLIGIGVTVYCIRNRSSRSQCDENVNPGENNNADKSGSLMDNQTYGVI